VIEAILGTVVIAAFALVIGAIYIWKKSGFGKKPALMLLLAAILLGNAAILSIPNERGVSPVNNGLNE